MMFWLTMAAQAVAGLVLAVSGPLGFEYAILPAAPAALAANRQGQRGLWAIGAAALGAMVGAALIGLSPVRQPLPGWLLTAYFAAISALGLLIGHGLSERWHYRTIVAALTALAGGVMTAAVLLFWSQWLTEANAYYEQFLTVLRERDGAVNENQQDVLRWILVDHWGDLGLGLIASSILAYGCIGVSAAGWLARRWGFTLPRRGSFLWMRPPDWFVWIAIADALLWFAVAYGEQEWLRPVVWNAAVFLAAVYGINGLSLVLYALRAGHARPLIYALVLAFILVAGVHLLCVFGFFDTWANFRRRFRLWRVLRARLRSQQPPGDGF